MKTTVSSEVQIVLPAEFRQRDGIEPGQEFDVDAGQFLGFAFAGQAGAPQLGGGHRGEPAALRAVVQEIRRRQWECAALAGRAA